MNPCNKTQYAENWAFLQHKCLPTNVDGITWHITERGGRFLFIEVKRGEDISGGQGFMLEALAKLPEFDVIIVHSLMDTPDEKNCRRVIPYAIQQYDKQGRLGDKEYCDEEKFRLRYHQWFRTQKGAQ
jgi:hypothetical protein